MKFLQCHFCAKEWPVSVSDEDPDSTLSDAMDHLQARHPDVNPFMALSISDVPRAPRDIAL